MAVHHMPSVPWRPEEGVDSFRTGVVDGCEPWYGFWDSNLGPLQEQVLLMAKPSLQPPKPLLLMQGLVMSLRLASNSQMFYFNILNSGTVSMNHTMPGFKNCWKNPLALRMSVGSGNSGA